jgi:hypothetical protein
MKYDYKQTFTSPDGVPFTHMKVCRTPAGPAIMEMRNGQMQLKQEEIPLTLGDAIGLVTQTKVDSDTNLSAVEIVNIGTAGIAAMKGQSLSGDQVTILKDRIRKVFESNPMLVALMHEALNNGDSDKSK